MNLEISLRSAKKVMHINDIKVPIRFRTTQPKLGKVLDKHYDLLTLGYADPIIVDEENNLIDGYISLIIAKESGRTDVKVFKITAKVG